MALLPQPGMFKDWKDWARLLIQAIGAAQIQTGSTTGVPTVLSSVEKSAYGGISPWPTLSPGEFMVSTNSVKSNSLIFVFPQTPPLGNLYEDASKRIVGQSFTVKSTDPTDTPDIAWVIFSPI